MYLGSCEMKSDSVILHRQAHTSFLQLKGERSRSSCSVPEAVAHGLSRNWQEMYGLFRGQPVDSLRVHLHSKIKLVRTIHAAHQ
jgi:hypothetical protein